MDAYVTPDCQGMALKTNIPGNLLVYPEDLCCLEDVSLLGWGLYQWVLRVVFSHGGGVDKLLEMIDQDRVIDLAFAANLYRSAVGEHSTKALPGEFGDSPEDMVWLLNKVPRCLVARHLKEAVAAAIPHKVGVPVDMAGMKRTLKEMVKTANMLADTISMACNNVWEWDHDKGRVVLDAYHLPKLDPHEAKKICHSAVHNATGMSYGSNSISSLYEAHPDVPILTAIVRYKRVQRDISRLGRMSSTNSPTGVVHPGAVEISRTGITQYSRPNFEEPAFRRSICSPSGIVTVDFGDTALAIAKQVAEKRGHSFLPLAKSLAHIGSVATNGKGKTATHRRLGSIILYSLVTGESVAQTAVKIWGHKTFHRHIPKLKEYLDRIKALNYSQKLQDPFKENLSISLNRSLGIGWEKEMIAVHDEPAECTVFSVVLHGGDPLRELPAKVVDSVWGMIESRSRDIRVQELARGREHGSEMVWRLFPVEGEDVSGLKLTGVLRNMAAQWSVYGSLHSVMRLFMWKVGMLKGRPLGISGTTVAVCGVGEERLMELAQEAQTEAGVAYPEPVLAHVGTRWA